MGSQVREDLVPLLRRVSVDGWNSAAGTAAVDYLERVCRAEARRWVRTAGWLETEGLSRVWEAMDGLVRSGRVEQAPKILRRVVQRAYAAEAAAIQTGTGSPSTRGLVRTARENRSAAVIHDDLVMEQVADPGDGVDEGAALPQWMSLASVLLARAGWRWPVAPLDAVMAVAACSAGTLRRERSPLAGHRTGVPDGTWAALDLLAFGSGPGCAPENARPPLALLVDTLGTSAAAGVPEVQRIVQAAVDGRPVRSGRHQRTAVAA